MFGINILKLIASSEVISDYFERHVYSERLIKRGGRLDSVITDPCSGSLKLSAN